MPLPFAGWLLARGKLTEAALERAERTTKQTGERLAFILSKLGLLSESIIVAELSAYYKVDAVDKTDFPAEALFSGRINRQFLLLHRLLPLAIDGDDLWVAMADPGDEEAVKAIGYFSGKAIQRRVAAMTDIEKAIQHLYGDGNGNGTATASEDISADPDDLDRLADLASDSPVIRFVHDLIADAVQTGASDIHIEPFIDRVRIRFRVDGLLREQDAQPKHSSAAIVSRIKVMAKLNIAECRLPQDGSIRFAVLGKEVDIRVSTSPTIYGESVVLRILDRDSVTLDFHALGFDDIILKPVLEDFNRPNGIILVTGPTGSGKTTTLYTALLELNRPEKKILTIEDPIEYKLDGINQQEVLPQIHRNFASALRSFLRQDPDILMVGEIRDEETARTAVQAALTGHLVLSTLHTNSAAGAITRLLDMGIEDYLLSSTVSGILGQRLVRKLCPSSRRSYSPMPDLSAKIFRDLSKEAAQAPVLCRAPGCGACRNSGYRGRTMVVEHLSLSDAIRKLILQKAGAQEIQQAAVSLGMRTMYQHGLYKALAGETTIEEVLRVTQEA